MTPPGENLEIVRRGIEAWNARDLDTMLELADPDIEYVNSPFAVETGTRHGKDEYARVLRTQWEIDAAIEPERHLERGDETLLVFRFSRNLPGSHVRMATRLGLRTTVRGGKIVRQELLPVDAIDAALAEFEGSGEGA